MRHLLEIDDLDAKELATILERATDPAPPQVLAGRGVALVFEKPSVRTRNSMEMAVVQLGGHPVAIRNEEAGIDTREPAEDIARTLGCYHALIGARVFEHEKVERIAAVSTVPVVNMLSDDAHPLQALADLLTVQDEWSSLAGRSIAYVGDANNVCRSLMLAGAMVGLNLRVAAPADFSFSAGDLDRLRAAGAEPVCTTRPEEAVEGADVVYTDVWTSMGQEAESARRRAAFEGFTIDDRLMARAAAGAIFLHCLPAHRGEEVSASVVEGDQSRVWKQAENRMHSARGAISWLMEQA